MSIPENNVYKVYIAATLDMEEEAKLLYQVRVFQRNITCSKGGIFKYDYRDWVDSQVMKITLHTYQILHLIIDPDQELSSCREADADHANENF